MGTLDPTCIISPHKLSDLTNRHTCLTLDDIHTVPHDNHAVYVWATSSGFHLLDKSTIKLCWTKFIHSYSIIKIMGGKQLVVMVPPQKSDTYSTSKSTS